MPQSAGMTAADVGASSGPGHPGRPWWRRLAVAASAAALVGATLATGGAVAPAPGKGHQSAYISGEVVLEADPDLVAAAGLSGTAEGLGAGMALVSRSLPVMKNQPLDLSAAADRSEAPACISSPIEPGRYRLTSPYGYRVHPIFGTYTMHTGTDFAAPLGTPIHAVTDGTVVYTGAGRLGRSSELVIIEHEVEGTVFYSWYVHMYPDGVFVTPGQRVASGEVIAEVGNNGNSTGPHVHLEIHTSDAGLDLGLQKNTGARFTSSLLTVLTPNPEDPSEEESEEPTDGESEDPSEEESEEPTDGESEDPSEEESEEPTDGESEDPSDQESEEPTDGESPSPSPSPSQTPSPTPTPSPEETESPTAESPTAEPTEEPTDEDGEEDEEVEDERADTTPFPIRAYGTTVEPFSFFASFGLTMVHPSDCFTPRAR